MVLIYRTVTALIWTQGYTEEKRPGSPKAVSDCDLLLTSPGGHPSPLFPLPNICAPCAIDFFSEVERRIQAAGGGLVFGVLCCCHAWPVATRVPAFCQPQLLSNPRQPDPLAVL